ncbi:MAG: response regulator [Desulfuromonadaceae bacterium]|nr:response regulator [Desulfuromonadaceae bacterium]MDD2856125.1 response regulator [Desulfuromonadaceae bacterium]
MILVEQVGMKRDKVDHRVQDEAAILPELHRVLMVDDEPSICFAYRKLLEREKFHFDISDNIESALSMLQEERYFAVISDVRFAGSDNQDGLSLINSIRLTQPDSKVILVTGFGSQELEKRAKELGAHHYFEKPVKPSIILSLLRSLHTIADELDDLRQINDYLLTSEQFN